MLAACLASCVTLHAALCRAGVLLNMSALVLFGVSSSSGVNAFIPAAILLGLGNITFHLAQFHVSALFPRSRGLVASVFVAGFTGCGIIMYLLMLVFEGAGSTQYVHAWRLRACHGKVSACAACALPCTHFAGSRVKRMRCCLPLGTCNCLCLMVSALESPNIIRDLLRMWPLVRNAGPLIGPSCSAMRVCAPCGFHCWRG